MRVKVSSATIRARHTGTVPACTCVHSFGSRQATSRAWPMNRRPASVDIPVAAANSATAYSPIPGAPAPASGTSVP